MTAVASTFSIWSNRHSLRGGSDADTLYGAGPGQSQGAHKFASSADARYPPVYGKVQVGYRGKTRLWTNSLGPYYDWLTEPAPPPDFNVGWAYGATKTIIGGIR